MMIKSDKNRLQKYVFLALFMTINLKKVINKTALMRKLSTLFDIQPLIFEVIPQF